MKEYLVKIEFRYHKIERNEPSYTKTTCTVGVYKDFDEACRKGNEALELLESKFELNPNMPFDSRLNRFNRTGAPFNTKNTLVTNMAYLKTPFDFFAKIETLEYMNLNSLVDGITTMVEEVRLLT